MNLVNELHKLPEGCIFALFNPDRAKAQLFLCKNGLLRIQQIINDLRNNEHSCKELCNDLNNLQLTILETNNDQDILRLHMQYWFDYIESVGLTPYKKHTYLKYKARITVGYDYDAKKRVFVELVNRRNESFVVGVFKKMYEAKEFKDQYFDTQKYVFPVYANNDLTKKFSEQRDNELEEVFRVRV